MLHPNLCLELEIFRNNELDQDTDELQATVSPKPTVDNLQILKTILKHKDRFIKATVDVEGRPIEVRDCLLHGKVMLVYPRNTKLKNIFPEDELELHDAQIEEDLMPLLVVSDLTRNSDKKLDFICRARETNVDVKLLADYWPFKRDLEDVLTGVVIKSCVDFLSNAFEQLLPACFEETDAYQSGSKLLPCPKLQLGQHDFPEKCYRLGYALFCTKMTVLDRQKQKFLKQLKHFRDQFKNQTSNDNSLRTSSFSTLMVRLKLEQLKNKYPDQVDVLNKIMYVLDVHEYQKLHKYKEVPSFLMEVLHLVENHHKMPVEWPSGNHDFIVSPLAEVKAALYELKGAVGSDNTQVVDLLERMHSEVHKHIIVKKIQEEGLRTATHVPVYSPHCTHKVSCLIVNNIDFPDNKKRWGANIDEANIVDIFNQIGYKIFSICRNMTSTDFMDKMKKWKDKLKKEEFTSLVLVVMSHGGHENNIVERSVIQFADHEMIPVQDILNMFTLKEFCVPDMPKIFLFQICRGKKMLAVKTEASTDVSSRNILNTFPNVSDTLVAYGTAPGYESYRFWYAGTLFISELCDVFRKHAYDTHFQDMLIIVNERMRHRRTLGDLLQTCCFENYGFKHFYCTN